MDIDSCILRGDTKINIMDMEIKDKSIHIKEKLECLSCLIDIYYDDKYMFTTFKMMSFKTNYNSLYEYQSAALLIGVSELFRKSFRQSDYDKLVNLEIKNKINMHFLFCNSRMISLMEIFINKYDMGIITSTMY